MGRLRVRNEEDSQWIDICQSEFLVRDPSNTRWIRLRPGKLALRHGSNSYWINIDCITDNECDDDPYGGTVDGRGANGSGPGLPIDPITGLPIPKNNRTPDGPDNKSSGGKYAGGGGSEGTGGTGGTGTGGTGTGTGGTNTGTPGSSSNPSGVTNPEGGGNTGNNSQPTSGAVNGAGKNQNSNWGDPNAGSSSSGGGDTNCPAGTYTPGQSYPPGYDLPDACGASSGQRTTENGTTCIVRESLAKDASGNVIPANTTNRAAVEAKIREDHPTFDQTLLTQIGVATEALQVNGSTTTDKVVTAIYAMSNIADSWKEKLKTSVESLLLSGLCETNQTGLKETTCGHEGTYSDPLPCFCTAYGIPTVDVIEFYIHMQGTTSGNVNFVYAVTSGKLSIDLYQRGQRKATTNGKVGSSGIIKYYHERNSSIDNDIIFVRIRQDKGSDWQLSWTCPWLDSGDLNGTQIEPAPCHGTFTPTHGGGQGVHEFIHDMGKTAGQVVIEYQMWNIADRMDVYYRGQKVASTNVFVAGEGNLSFNYTPVGNDNLITVRMTSSSTDTSWVYLVNCPNEKGSSTNPKPCGADITSGTTNPSRLENLVRSGGAGVTDTWYRMSNIKGTATIRYQMYNIMDSLEVFQNKVLIASTGGPVAGEAYLDFPFDPAKGLDILIRVTGTGKTSWSYLVICPYAAPALSINDKQVTEGDSGTLNMAFTVSFAPNTPVAREVKVDYATTNGTAIAGTDFVNTTGTLTIPVGQTSGTINVPIIGDTVAENTESFTITLTNPRNATIAKATGTGTILDTDYSPPSLVLTGTSVTESHGPANGGINPIAVFNVKFADNTPRNRNVSVNYATVSGTATSGIDFVASSGTLTIPAGQTSGNINVTVLGDKDIESDETFTLQLSNPVNATIGTGSAIGTIVNDDFFSPPVLVMSGGGNITEGNSGTKNLPFTLSFQDGQPRTLAVSVRVKTVAGTATAGSDFTAIDTLITFNPGETTKTVNVSIIGDTDAEIDEAFTLEMYSPTNAVLGTTYKGTGTIINDDAPVTPCNQTSSSGGSGVTTNTHYIGQGSGTVTINCDAYSVPDGFEAIYNGNVVATTGGLISGKATLSFFHNFATTGKDTFQMRVTGSSSGTSWVYTVNCP